jgi:hypothetical protein
MVLALGLLAYAVVACLYVVGAHVLARKLGIRVLPFLWLITSLVVGGLAFRRVYQPYLVSDPIRWGQLWIAVGFGVMFFLAFGAATLSVRARLRRDPGARLTARTLARGVVSFFAGIAIVLAIFLVLDVRRLLSP